MATIKEHTSKFWKDICTCTFISAGTAMDNSGCVLHPSRDYRCDDCSCTNYRPNKEPNPPAGYWPNCVCGHIAQSHN